jgi:hypothetical protein
MIESLSDAGLSVLPTGVSAGHEVIEASNSCVLTGTVPMTPCNPAWRRPWGGFSRTDHRTAHHPEKTPVKVGWSRGESRPGTLCHHGSPSHLEQALMRGTSRCPCIAQGVSHSGTVIPVKDERTSMPCSHAYLPPEVREGRDMEWKPVWTACSGLVTRGISGGFSTSTPP